MKILFITSNRVGDAVLSTGLLAYLVNSYPKSSFTIACGPYASDLFRAVPRLELLLILKKQSWNRHWLLLWQKTYQTNWDMIVDLRNSLVSRLLRGKQKAYHRATPLQHKVLEIGNMLALDPPPSPFIWLDAEAETEANLLCGQGTPLLALAPAANWSLKQWPLEYFISLSQTLTSQESPLSNAKILVIADEKERGLLAGLFEALPKDKVIPVIGKSLLTVAACLKKARLFVGNDSGLMHLSAAVGTPTLGLFGPGYEKIYGPWGKNAAFVRTPESQAELLSRIPKTGSAPNLMASLTSESVLEAVTQLFEKTKSQF